MLPLRFGLIGREISHSLSPEIYKRLITQPHTYDLIDCSSIEEIPSVSELALKYTGINITSPWKEVFLPYADDESRLWEAVNCLRFDAGAATAINTDALALQELIPRVFTAYQGHDFVILGDGAMSRVCLRIMTKLGLPVVVRSRKKGDDIARASFVNSHSSRRTIIVNACAREFEYRGKLSSGCVFWDLNYKHSFHSKMSIAEGWTYIDGHELLETQAKYAVNFWRIEKSN